MEPIEPGVPTQGEVDEVIRKTRSGDLDASAAERPRAPMIKIYDFKRPDKFSKDQTRVMQVMHENFARLTTTTLSAQLGCLAHVHLASVDQLTYEEFIRSVPNPTTLGRVDMAPLKGEAILEIDPSVTFAMIDRLFGGRGDGFKLTREISSIESFVMAKVISRVLGNLRETWSKVVDLRPTLGGIETNPLFAQIVPPTEMVILMTLDTRIGEVEGMMNFCIPYLTIQDIMPKLSQQFYYSPMRRPIAPPLAAAVDLPFAVEVLYEGDKLSLGELTRLRKGSRVRIPAFGNGQAIFRGGGAPLFRLEIRRGRGKRQPTYTLSEGHDGASLAFLVRRRKPSEAETPPDALQLAVRSLSAEIAEAMESMDGKISGIARRQEELADQLIFQSPDKEVAATEEPAPHKQPIRPFHFVSISGCDTLATLIGGEHPQLIALVLSYVDPALAACVLKKLPAETQTDVTARIAMMGRTHPETLRDVERVLEEQLKVTQSEGYFLAGGLDAVTEILGVVDRGTERHVLESLEKLDPEMAEDIKRQMLVFEDIVLLVDEDVGKVLKEVSEEDLLLALRAVEELVRAKVWASLDQAKAVALQGKLAQIGRVRLRDAEAAQQRIVGVIRRMEEEGKIEIARAG